MTEQYDITEISETVSRLTDGRAVLVPDNTAIKNLECYHDQVLHFKGVYSTNMKDEWVSYVNGYATEHSTVFIDHTDMSAQAIIDLGSPSFPKHQLHKANLSLEKEPLFEEILNLDGYSLKQKQLVKWFEDWGQFVMVFDTEGEVMSESEVLASVRTMNVKSESDKTLEVGDMSAQLSSSERIEATSKGRMISEMKLSTQPYDGLDDISILLRLSISANSDNISSFTWRIVGRKMMMNQIYNNFKNIVKSEVSIPVCVGVFR